MYHADSLVQACLADIAQALPLIADRPGTARWVEGALQQREHRVLAGA